MPFTHAICNWEPSEKKIGCLCILVSQQRFGALGNTSKTHFQGVPELHRDNMLREGSNIILEWGLSTNGLKGQIYKSAIKNKETVVLRQSVGLQKEKLVIAFGKGLSTFSRQIDLLIITLKH
jgi:hypothetical protein